MQRKKLFNVNGNDEIINRRMIGGNVTNLFNLNNVKYQWANKVYRLMMENFWIPEKVSLFDDKRAYEELEREGFIVSLTGKGSFVAGANTELIREAHLRRLEDHLREAVSLSQLCGLDLDGLTSILSMLYKEEDL